MNKLNNENMKKLVTSCRRWTPKVIQPFKYGLSLIKLHPRLSMIFTLVFALGMIVYKDASRSNLVIELSAIPQILIEKGYTKEGLMDQLVGQINIMGDNIPEVLGMKGDDLSNLKLDKRMSIQSGEPMSMKLDFGSASISVANFVAFIRPILGYTDHKVVVQLLSNRDDFRLYVRVDGHRADERDFDLNKPDDSLKPAAEYIVKHVEPLMYLSYITKTYNKMGGKELLRKALVNFLKSQGKRDSAYTMNVLGVYLKELGDVESALNAFKQSLELDPNADYARINLGYLYFIKNQDEKVIEYLLPVTKLDSNRASGANALLALAYHRSGKYKNALKHYQALPTNDRRFLDLAGFWGVALLELKEYDDANLKFALANVLEPDDTYTLRKWSESLQAQDRYDDAISKMERAVEISPDGPVVLDAYGDALGNGGRTTLAISAYEKVLSMVPKDKGVIDKLKKLRLKEEAEKNNPKSGDTD